MFDWQRIKTNSFFMRKVWLIYGIIVVIFSLRTNQHQITLGHLYLLAGAMVFLFGTYIVYKLRLEDLNQQQFYYFQFLDMGIIILALSLTSWQIPVSFLIYLALMKTVLIHDRSAGLRLAVVTGISFAICYRLFAIDAWTSQEIQYVAFSVLGMILTAVVSEVLKEQVKAMEEANIQLVLRNSELFTLQQVSNHVSSVLNIDDLLQLIPDILLGISGAKYVAIYLTDDQTFESLKLKATNCQDEELVQELFLGVSGQQMRSTFQQCVSSIENCMASGEFASLMCVPIRHKEDLLGVMVLTHYRANAFSEKSLQLLEPVAGQLGIAIANAHLYDQVKRLANLDGLTGVYNRKYFQDELARICKDPRARQITLIMLDVDHFKKVNDTFGHLMGDQVLKVMTDVIEQTVGEQGILARYGGEEFVVLLPDQNINQGYQIAEQIRKEIYHQQVAHHDRSCHITVSIGVASNNLPGIEGMDDLLNATDAALYQAKESGRNQTILAS